MRYFHLPKLSEEPNSNELDEFYSDVIRYIGPNCDASQFLGTLRFATHDELFSSPDSEYDKHQFEIAYYSIPPNREALISTINRLKDSVW